MRSKANVHDNFIVITRGDNLFANINSMYNITIIVRTRNNIIIILELWIKFNSDTCVDTFMPV